MADTMALGAEKHGVRAPATPVLSATRDRRALEPTRSSRASRGNPTHDLSASGGRPLDRSARAFMEPLFGRDFSHVRVHTERSAAESARDAGFVAYASGHHIVFAAGVEPRMDPSGRWLLAH